MPPAGRDSAEAIVTRGASVTRTFAPLAIPWQLETGFTPLGVVIARLGGRIWTREIGLDD